MKYLFIYFLLLNSCKSTQNQIDTNTNLKMQEPVFEVILESVTDGKTEHAWEVIDSKAKLETLYSVLNATIQPKHQLPEINFDNQIVVALFLGEKNSGGYHIVPINVINENDKIIISYKEISPKPTDMATMSLTQPYCLIKVNNPKEEVVFKKITDYLYLFIIY